MLDLTRPVLYPAIIAFGFYPLWFAVFFVVMAQVACRTPPIGMNLFVIHGIAQNYPNPESPDGFTLGQDVYKRQIYTTPTSVSWIGKLLRSNS